MKQFAVTLALAVIAAGATSTEFRWKHLSTANGDLPLPNKGTEQTSTTIADFDKDGINDFVITERTAPDSVVLFRRGASGWPGT